MGSTRRRFETNRQLKVSTDLLITHVDSGCKYLSFSAGIGFNVSYILFYQTISVCLPAHSEIANCLDILKYSDIVSVITVSDLVIMQVTIKFFRVAYGNIYIVTLLY